MAVQVQHTQDRNVGKSEFLCWSGFNKKAPGFVLGVRGRVRRSVLGFVRLLPSSEM